MAVRLRRVYEPAALEHLRSLVADRDRVTLVLAAKGPDHNQAVVLQRLL